QWLEDWLRHPLWARARASGKMARELPFNLQLSALEALGEAEGDPVMVQGVIDLAFLEGGQWVLVDYKTGDILPGMEQAYLAHYAPQLELYRLALQRLTGRPVREAGLYILPRALYLPLGGEDASV
ncbi:MAG: PD-(D/E)XK nuclease family protein, partial [Christensenellaceae bacterium]